MRHHDTVRRAPGGVGGRANLVHALAIALGVDHVRNPPVALTPGAHERRIRAPADPDRGTGLLHRLRIDRYVLERAEAALERRRRVTPQRADDVDRFGHARAALLVRHAGEFELLRVLAPDPDAED